MDQDAKRERKRRIKRQAVSRGWSRVLEIGAWNPEITFSDPEGI